MKNDLVVYPESMHDNHCGIKFGMNGKRIKLNASSSKKGVQNGTNAITLNRWIN
jgi:hypothetical protein